MLMVPKNANTGLPLYSFCNEFLIGSKYAQTHQKANSATRIFYTALMKKKTLG
jgi:hypothetical protein